MTIYWNCHSLSLSILSLFRLRTLLLHRELGSHHIPRVPSWLPQQYSLHIHHPPSIWHIDVAAVHNFSPGISFVWYMPIWLCKGETTYIYSVCDGIVTMPTWLLLAASVPPVPTMLTRWGQVTHTYVGNLNTIRSNSGLSPCRCQAIIWTNIGILLIGPIGTSFCEISVGIQIFSFMKIPLKTSSGNDSHVVSASIVLAPSQFSGFRGSVDIQTEGHYRGKWNVGHWGNVGHNFIMAMHNIDPAYAFQFWRDHLYEFQYCYMIVKISPVATVSPSRDCTVYISRTNINSSQKIWTSVDYKRQDILPPNLVKFRNRNVGCYNHRTVLKSGRHFGSAAAEVPMKFRAIGKV